MNSVRARGLLAIVVSCAAALVALTAWRTSDPTPSSDVLFADPDRNASSRPGTQAEVSIAIDRYRTLHSPGRGDERIGRPPACDVHERLRGDLVENVHPARRGVPLRQRSDGRLRLEWSRLPGQNPGGPARHSRRRRRSLTGRGRSWEPPLRVSGATDQDDKVALAVDDDRDSPYRDRVYVAWKWPMGRVYFSRSEDSGATFSPPQMIEQAFTSGGTSTVAGDGAVYLAFHDNRRRSIRVMHSTDGGATFDPLRRRSGPSGAVVRRRRRRSASAPALVYASVAADRSAGPSRGAVYVGVGGLSAGSHRRRVPRSLRGPAAPASRTSISAGPSTAARRGPRPALVTDAGRRRGRPVSPVDPGRPRRAARSSSRSRTPATIPCAGRGRLSEPVARRGSELGARHSALERDEPHDRLHAVRRLPERRGGRRRTSTPPGPTTAAIPWRARSTSGGCSPSLRPTGRSSNCRTRGARVPAPFLRDRSFARPQGARLLAERVIVCCPGVRIGRHGRRLQLEAAPPLGTHPARDVPHLDRARCIHPERRAGLLRPVLAGAGAGSVRGRRRAALRAHGRPEADRRSVRPADGPSAGARGRRDARARGVRDDRHHRSDHRHRHVHHRHAGGLRPAPGLAQSHVGRRAQAGPSDSAAPVEAGGLVRARARPRVRASSSRSCSRPRFTRFRSSRSATRGYRRPCSRPGTRSSRTS